MTPNRSSRVLKIAMGLALIIMGAGGAAWLWLSAQRAAETRAWTPVEAVVISSQVLTARPTPHSPVEFTADVRYRYTFLGKAFTGHRIKLASGGSAHREKAAALVAAHRPGSTVTCFVNPAQPDMAVLEHRSRIGPLMALILPLLIIAGGAGTVLSALREKA